MNLGAWMLVGCAVALGACGGKAAVASSAEGGSGGSEQRTCEQLSTDYAQYLGQARACDRQVSKDQCTAKVLSGIFCGCPTFANADNEEALAAMEAATKAWDSQGCGDEVPCGKCQPDPGFAVCGTTDVNSPLGECFDNR